MTTKKVDLRSKSGNTLPFSPKKIDLPGFKGTLPFQPGKAIATLDDSGLPPSMQRAADAFVEETSVTNDELKAKAIVPPPPVSFDSLPEAKQSELLDIISSTLTPTKAKVEKPAVNKPTDKPKEEVKEEVSPIQTEVKQDNKPALCTHCGFPSGQCDYTKPNNSDKQTFVASILGGKRFYKTYGLLGGQLNVTFRSLTTKEIDIILEQLVFDWNNSKLSGPAHSASEANRYQMLLSLQSVEGEAGTNTLPELQDYECDPVKNSTILPQVIEHVTTTALNNEPLRRIVAKTFGHFVDTLSKLEAMAETSDFWKATEE